LLFEPSHGLCHDARSNAEDTFDHALFTDGVAGQVEGQGLPFSQGAHDLKSLDRGIGRFHRLKPAHRFDQLFQIAVVGFDDVVEILDLPVLNILWALTFLLQFPDRLSIASSFISVNLLGFSQSLQPFIALPRKRLAAFALRVADK